jgi:hypothetical protein
LSFGSASILFPEFTMRSKPTGIVTTTVLLLLSSLLAVTVPPVSGNTNNLLGTITGLNAAETVAILPGLKFVVEADFGSNNAIFVDSENFTISKRVPVGVHPRGGHRG